jgi:lipopolysaccharide transport system ATP-binding protein
MARVELENASVTFRITERGPVSLRDWVRARFAPRFGNPIMEVRALNDVSLRFSDGDRVGIIGHNGAGKSTLLKVLADIYPLTSGVRQVQGRVSSLFNVMFGFEAQATGWDNIRYCGYLQGESRKSMLAKIKEIGEFSELGDYLRMPVQYYSTGMRIRLGFSIATAIQPDILLVDEALGAGDLQFRAKAKARIRSVMSSASIVVAVSHEHKMLSQICDRMIWLNQGSIVADGASAEVIRAYRQEVLRTQAVRGRAAA